MGESAKSVQSAVNIDETPSQRTDVRMTENPDLDQKRAELRDLQRLRSLVAEYTANGGTVDEILAAMPPEVAAEARALLDRLGPVSEDPKKTAARQKILLDTALLECVLLEMRANPQPRISNGKVVLDPETGEPVPNKTMQQKVEAQLRRVRQMRSNLTGLPVENDEA